MDRVLYCPTCARPTAVAIGSPDRCLSCNTLVEWRETSPAPQIPYTLSTNDRRFLRSLKIAVEQD